MLPQESRAAFVRAYGKIESETWAVAKVRALWVTVAGLAAAADTDDEDTVHEMKETLERLIA